MALVRNFGRDYGEVGRHGNSSSERERGATQSDEQNSQSAAARLPFGPALVAGGMRGDSCRFLLVWVGVFTLVYLMGAP
jgi:hypothetical protein